MLTFPIPGSWSDIIAKNNSLQVYLGGIEAGKKSTRPSWLFETVKHKSSVFADWSRIMDRELRTTQWYESMLEFENSKLDKLGPQGAVPAFGSSELTLIMEPEFEKSTFDSELVFKSLFSKAHEFGKILFHKYALSESPKSLNEVIDDMHSRDALHTSSGFPLMSKRFQNLDVEMRYAETGEWHNFPALLLFRSYRGKIRMVWIYPMSRNLAEFRYSQPVQHFLSERAPKWVQNWVTPWLGFNFVKEQITSLWSSFNCVYGGDTTAMDAHMRRAQIRVVYEIIKWLFKPEFHSELYDVLMQVTDIPLICTRTQAIFGNHGIASGSGWTQLTETIFILFISWLTNVTEGMGEGDDFIWFTKGFSWNKKLIATYLMKFGLPAKESKQSASMKETMFLNRTFYRDFYSRENNKILGAYYSTLWALNTMIFPERWFTTYDWQLFAIRCISILENCCDDPEFPEFIKFVAKGSVYLQTFSRLKREEQDAVQAKARLVTGLFPNYNQEKKEKPISEYISVKLLSEI